MGNSNKIILHLCCSSLASDSEPYRAAGYDVREITKDVGIENYHPPKGVYGVIANPPCVNFSRAKTSGEPKDLREGMRLVRECQRVIDECQYDLERPFSQKTTLKFWMLENPNGLLKHFLGRPAFQFHPWEFGDPYTKSTHIWGWFNLPKKQFYLINLIMNAEHKRRCRLHMRKLPKIPGMNRQEKRAICSPGFARAFFNCNQ